MENLPYFECPGCELTMWAREDLWEHLKVAHSYSPSVLDLISRIEDLYRHDGNMFVEQYLRNGRVLYIRYGDPEVLGKTWVTTNKEEYTVIYSVDDIVNYPVDNKELLASLLINKSELKLKRKNAEGKSVRLRLAAFSLPPLKMPTSEIRFGEQN